MAAGDRRQQILEVAVRLFSQRGFRGTTTKEIAQAAGVNEAIIFRHFATKSDLYAAMIDRKACTEEIQAMQRSFDETTEGEDDRKVFETFAFTMLEFHEHDESAMRLLLYSALEGHELADMIFKNHISKTHHQLANYVKKRIASGVYRRVDPMVAVRGFMGMLINHVMHKKFFDRENTLSVNLTNRQAAEKFTDLFLASLTNHDYEKSRLRRK